MPSKPRIALTLGDPAGIGPEIVAKVIALPELYRFCTPLVIGDKRLVQSLLPAKSKNLCRFIHQPLAGIENLKPGSFSVLTGRASYDAVLCAAKLALSGGVEGIVTAPLSKAALNLAGVRYPGHTELLAALSKSRNYAMLMVAGTLRTVMVTRHIPVADTGRALSLDGICSAVLLANDLLKTRFGIPAPRISVCALNPHAGEGGLLGKEEGTVILPAIKKLRELCLDVSGPLPCDSAWVKLKKKKFDLLVAMYHDQAMIGLKCLLPEKIVNVTAGLPFVRTSPGHGTGFDIAGKNRADHRPMLEAVRVAAALCTR